MEQLLILLVIAVLSALHSWWKKKQGAAAEEEEDGDGNAPLPPRPGRTPPPPRAPASNWEEELRRILQGEEAPAPRPMAPPPFVVAAPPALPPAPRPVVRQSAAPKPHLAHSNIPIPLEGEEEEIGLAVRLPSLEQNVQAFLRRSSIERMAADHLQNPGRKVTDHCQIPPHRRGVSPDAQRALALLRERGTQRTAIIASIILGPPKALEVHEN